MASPKPTHVPVIAGPRCGKKSPKSGLPCRRAEAHHGRHAFLWLKADPGRVREVWENADCQVCRRETTDGAVCRECGA